MAMTDEECRQWDRVRQPRPKVYRTKCCQACGKEYQPTTGTQKYCKECICERKRLVNAAWAKANREKNRKSTANWAKANSERVRANGARYRKANPEKLRLKNVTWYDANPGKRCAMKEKHRALKYFNTPVDEMLTSTEWLAILAEANGHCVYCDKKAKLTMDHVIPLSKGGKHSASNVVPACAHCNGSKHDKTLEEWGRIQELNVTVDKNVDVCTMAIEGCGRRPATVLRKEDLPPLPRSRPRPSSLHLDSGIGSR